MSPRSKIQPERIETGTAIGDLFLLEDDGFGSPELPPVGGGNLTNVVVTGFQIVRVRALNLTIANNRTELRRDLLINDGIEILIDDGGELLLI